MLQKNRYICGIKQSIPKENSLNWFTYFLQKKAAPLISVDKCLVCSVSLLITKAKPEKLFQNSCEIFVFALTQN